MVINGGSRSGEASYTTYLGMHLQRVDTNERVLIRKLDGVAAVELTDALREMAAVGAGARSRLPLYHANIDWRHDETMTDAQKARAVERLGQELGLADQPHVVVEHVKDGREHLHVVWLRIDAETMKAIPDSHNFRKHEIVARELEREFGHERVQGAHIERDGEERPKRCPTLGEVRQAERSGLTPEEAKAQLRTLWNAADNGQAFTAALADAGWVLAQGDRRGFVALDPTGEARALNKDITGLSAAKVRDRLSDIDADQLPSVEEARKQIEAHRVAVAERQAEDQSRQAAVLERDRADQAKRENPMDQHTTRAVARALDELAQTDPLRFAAAAAGAEDVPLQRPEQSWTGRTALQDEAERRQRIEEQAEAAMQRAEARWKPEVPASQPQPSQDRPRIDYLARIRQAAEARVAEPVQTAEPARDRVNYLSRIPKAQEQPDLADARAGQGAETAQQPSSESRPPDRSAERTRLAEIVTVMRDRLASLVDRMERAFVAVVGRHQEQPQRVEEPRSPLAMPAAQPHEKQARDVSARIPREDKLPEIRPAERMVESVEAKRDASSFEQRKAEAERRRAEMFKSERIDEVERERRRELERARDRGRSRHHRPFLQDILGYIRKHHHWKHDR